MRPLRRPLPHPALLAAVALLLWRAASAEEPLRDALTPVPALAAQPPADLASRVRDLEALVRSLREEWARHRFEEGLAQAQMMKTLLLASFQGRTDDAYLPVVGVARAEIADIPAFEAVRRRVPFLPPAISGVVFFPGTTGVQLSQLSTEFAAALREAAESAPAPDARLRGLVDWGYRTRFRWPDAAAYAHVLEWRDYRALLDKLDASPK